MNCMLIIQKKKNSQNYQPQICCQFFLKAVSHLMPWPLLSFSLSASSLTFSLHTFSHWSCFDMRRPAIKVIQKQSYYIFRRKQVCWSVFFFFITKYHSPLQIHPSLILCSGGMSSLWQVVCEKITQLRFRIYTVGSTLHDYSMISLIILDNLLSILLWSKPFKIVHD